VPVIDANMSSRIDAYLAGKNSPLAGLGNVFVFQGTAVGLDPRLLVAISGAETSFGTYGPSQTIHNPFGMGPGIVYPTWPDAIAAAARNLGGNLYKGSGLVTIAQIQRRWAPLGAGNDPTNLNSHWYVNVSRYYSELGGDPNGTVFVDRGAPATAIPVAPGVAPGIQGTVAAPSAYGAAVAVPGGGRNTGPKALALAQTYLGVPYVWGGTTPKGFDCSGLVQYVYAKQGVTLPRVAEAQARVGVPIAPEQLQAGDAIFFADRTGYIHHEGMYIGNGMFIHAPHTGDVVKISSLYDPYYASQYAGSRRY
jgi:cell wall-associated NlpC family hydrolase